MQTHLKGNNITSITIPSTVTDIKDGAFSQMKGLTSINVESGSAKYSATDGVLYENKSERKVFKLAILLQNKEQLTV